MGNVMVTKIGDMWRKTVLQWRMTFIKSALLAFSMFSRIPVPRVSWNEKNMRYMLCAFPLVGVVICVACAFVQGCVAEWVLFYGKKISLPLIALCLTLLPVLITGGIHLDGFLDTCDALASHADREKKLAIMKDPHCGSFAVIACVLYFLSQFVLLLALCEKMYGGAVTISSENAFAQLIPGLCVCASFVLSRFLSACAVAAFPIAKDSGLVRTFSDASAKRFTAMWCVFWFVAVSALSVWLGGRYGIAVVGAQVVVFIGYFVMTKRNFGGITGDTAGWFVQVAELFSLSAVVVMAEFWG